MKLEHPEYFHTRTRLEALRVCKDLFLDLVERWPTGGIDQVRDILWAPQSRIKVRELAKR